jgi:undecaprenyl-diphosphatase
MAATLLRAPRRGSSTSSARPTAAAVERAAAGAAGAVDRAARAADVATVSRWAAIARGRRARGVAVAGVAGFGALFGLVKAKRSEAFDVALTLRLQRRRRPWLDAVMTVVSWPGFPPQSRVIPPAIIGSLWLVRFRTEAAFEAAAWGAALVSTGLKTLMQRPRPVAGTDLRVVAAPLGGSSFPSGHVLTFVGVYGFLAWLTWTLIRDPALRAVSTGGLLGLLALVGPSRVYQGHHWATDVTASYLVGTSYLIVVIATYERVKASAVPAPVRVLAR